MKKIIAVAGAFALAACGGSDVDEPMEAEIEEPAAEVAASAAGTYSGTYEDGTEWSSTLNEDGTFTDTENGEVARTGTWTQDEVNGTCFMEDGQLEAAEPECFTMGEVAEDGTITVTNAAGESMTMTKVN